MKKIRAILFSVICMFCLSGCVRFNTTINVKSNGKLDVSMLYAAVDMSDYGYSGDTLTEDQKQEYINNGWNVSDYSRDGFNGFIISKEDITADELASSVGDTQAELAGDTGAIRFTKSGLKYVLDWQVFDKEMGEQISAYKNYFSMTGGYMKLTVTLPVKPSESNATSVSNDGKTLEWDLLNLGSDQSIHLEFMLINIWLIIGVCIAACIVIAVVIVILVVTSKKKKAAQIQMQVAEGAQQATPYVQNQYNPNQYQQSQVQEFTYQQGSSMEGSSDSHVEEGHVTSDNMIADEITKLKKLADDGVITKEEFEAQKIKLLNGMGNNQ